MDAFHSHTSPQRVTRVIVVPNANLIEKNNVKPVSKFYLAMKNVVILAHVFGLLPVSGISDNNVDTIKFKWISFKTSYSLIGTISILITAILFFMEFLREEMNFGFLVATIFYLGQSVCYILFIKLAMKWHELNKVWLDMEIKMEKYPNQPNMKSRFMVATVVIVVLSAVEHILSILKTAQLTVYCPGYEKDPIKVYFGLCCTNVFTITSYAHWKAALNEIPIILSTFSWNFVDLVIILLSAAIAERFRQINRHVLKHKFQDLTFWKGIREDYNMLWNLCKTLDSFINNLVTLSFANNLFFICWQMFNSLKPRTDLLNMIYFIFSFGYLLLRTITVSIYCCWINDESKELLATLFQISTENYSVEAERLIQQITSSPAVLTGSNLFAVTRGLCLQVASAIVTFEIILVQIGPSFLQTDHVRPLNCLS